MSIRGILITYDSDPKLEDFIITMLDIHKHIVELKDNKALGKDVAEEICYPLCTVFKKSFDTGVVPQDWRLANV